VSTSTDRYTIISADCHAGGNHQQYREYLTAEHQALFDAWRGEYKNPFRDLQDDGRSRNWDNERRNRDMESEGVAAEVVFPNTVPPFFPTGVVIAPAPSPEDFELRLAGIRAHNRWLADFVGAFPDRRFGQAQIFLNDVDEAIKDVRWCKDHGINGVLLPGASPDTPWIDALSSPNYDPLWAVCQELDMPVTHHSGGSGIPKVADTPIKNLIFIMETGFYANRAMWHMIWGGVFERFPKLKLVLTEQGSDWVLPLLKRMDGLYAQMKGGRHWKAEPSRDLRPQHLDRCQLPFTQRRQAVPRDRPRQGHVGQRLPAPRVHVTILERVAAPLVRRLEPRRHADHPGRQCRFGLRLRPGQARSHRGRARPHHRRDRHPARGHPQGRDVARVLPLNGGPHP
jgi:predicted TIM-barrel fold metal-dependent hydrolase